MKTLFRNLIAGILAVLAGGIIYKYKPTVVMVTGSVGKTSTKDAVAAALSKNFYVRKSDKSYNSDFGVPFTIIGVGNPWTNICAWMHVFGEALALLLLPTHYPKLLVLEVGADRPGDLAKILKITKPDAVVVTLLPSVPVHVEAYETPAAVRDEEFSPALVLPAGAPLIICAEDDFAMTKASRIETHPYTYGTRAGADICISDVDVWIDTENNVKGMQATLTISGKSYTLHIPQVIGRSQVFAPAAAVATACVLGMSPDEALEGLVSYMPPPGRGRIFKGKKGTLLIDDTYNSSPAAAEEILRSLDLLIQAEKSHLNHSGHSSNSHAKASRKVAILGDMLELGRYSVAEHARLGHIAKETVDVLVTVGARAKGIGEAALEDGFPIDSVHHFATSLEAAAAIEEILQEGDIVLVKGSQGVRMERIVRPLLADFADVPKLVRQDTEWLKR